MTKIIASTNMSKTLSFQVIIARFILTFTLIAYGAINSYALPEIDIQGNDISIPSGSTMTSAWNHTNFGSIHLFSGTVSRTFKILNSGPSALSLNGTPTVSISGVHASDFTVTSVPSSSIPAMDSTYFTITFTPSGAGLRTAIITISNNDFDEKIYTFDVSGMGDCVLATSVLDTIHWTGNVDSDWSNPCNWIPVGIPTDSSMVQISNMPTNPTIGNSTSAYAKGIFIQGNTLTIKNGGALKIDLNSNLINIELRNAVIENYGLMIIGDGPATSLIGFIVRGVSKIYNEGNINTNCFRAVAVQPLSTLTFTNELNGVFNGDLRATNPSTSKLSILNKGTINYTGTSASNAIDLSSISTATNEGKINVTGGLGIIVRAGGNFENSSCASVILRSGTFDNSALNSYTANNGLIQISNTLNNTSGTFKNFGVLKYGNLIGSVSNSANSSIIVNNTSLVIPIFNYGGTYDGSINGIFLDSLQIESAGTFTAPNTFVPIPSLSPGYVNLFASITPNGGLCSYVVPFIYQNGCVPTVFNDTMTWTGAVSSNWNYSCNWNPEGIPNETNYVKIFDAMNDPIIENGVNAKATDIKIHSGILTLKGDATLTLEVGIISQSTSSIILEKSVVVPK